MGTTASYKDIAVALWELLDDIDTLDDAYKTDDKAFRVAVYKVQQKRHQYITSDGYRLFNTLNGREVK